MWRPLQFPPSPPRLPILRHSGSEGTEPGSDPLLLPHGLSSSHCLRLPWILSRLDTQIFTFSPLLYLHPGSPIWPQPRGTSLARNLLEMHIL